MSTPDSHAVNAMFGRIACRYDLANRVLSGGMDIGWRRRLVWAVARQNPKEILDLATGSGDVAFALSRGLGQSSQVLGMDFCLPMLAQAEEKKAASGEDFSNVRFAQGDGLALPLADSTFEAVTISFGLRNMADRAKSLSEMRRVLRPGGGLFVLEFSQPSAWFKPIYFFYLRHVLPAIATLATSDRAAYVYLNESIEQFPGRDALSEEIRCAGFSSVRATPMAFGGVALHEATA